MEDVDGSNPFSRSISLILRISDITSDSGSDEGRSTRSGSTNLFSGSSMVRAPGLHPGCCRFDPYPENQEGWQSPAYRTALEMRQGLKTLRGSNPLPSANVLWRSGRIGQCTGLLSRRDVKYRLPRSSRGSSARYGEMAESGLLRRIGSAVGPKKPTQVQILFSPPIIWVRGVISNRVGLRILWGNPWRCKSSRTHQFR